MLRRFLLSCIYPEQIADTENNWLHLHAFHVSLLCVSLITGAGQQTRWNYIWQKHLLYDQENIAGITEIRELGWNMKLSIQVLLQANVQNHTMCLPVVKSFTDSTLFYQ